MQEIQEMRVQSLGQKDPLEQEMEIHFSIQAWKSHGQRSLEGYSPWGHRVGQDGAHMHTNNVQNAGWHKNTLTNRNILASYK